MTNRLLMLAAIELANEVLRLMPAMQLSEPNKAFLVHHAEKVSDLVRELEQRSRKHKAEPFIMAEYK